MMKNIKIKSEDLVGEPESRMLATGKRILAFRIKKNDQTKKLNSGDKLDYNDVSYKILNRESVQSKTDYFKFNCVLLSETGDPSFFVETFKVTQ